MCPIRRTPCAAMVFVGHSGPKPGHFHCDQCDQLRPRPAAVNPAQCTTAQGVRPDFHPNQGFHLVNDGRKFLGIDGGKIPPPATSLLGASAVRRRGWVGSGQCPAVGTLPGERWPEIPGHRWPGDPAPGYVIARGVRRPATGVDRRRPAPAVSASPGERWAETPGYAYACTGPPLLAQPGRTAHASGVILRARLLYCRPHTGRKTRRPAPPVPYTLPDVQTYAPPLDMCSF